MFHEGQWVITKLSKRVGYILELGKFGNKVLIEIPSTGEFGWVGIGGIDPHDDILPEAKEDAKPVLIEMSLMTKDENLFWEVMN